MTKDNGNNVLFIEDSTLFLDILCENVQINNGVHIYKN